VRIGIRDPREKSGDHPRRKAGEFVLKNISKDHKEEMSKVFENLATKFLGAN
jgi:peptidyl-tRNA hydrolase